MMLSQALHYPFQGKGWFRHILMLALIQLFPIVGQLILLGYGLDIVRAVYAGQTELPPLRWLPALSDGFRFLLAGLFYLLPLIVTIAVVMGVSRIGSHNSFSNLGVFSILLAVGLPLIFIVIRLVFMRRPGSPSAQQSHGHGSRLRSVISGLLSIVITVLVILVLRTLVSSSGLEAGKPNGLSILVFAVLALLLFVISIGLYVGGVRYAIEHKGLLAATANARLLLNHSTHTGVLLLNVLLLDVLAIVAISVGLVLFILPSLFVFVICSLALWHMFARYSIFIGLYTSASSQMENKMSLL